jgi:hypothetical protein
MICNAKKFRAFFGGLGTVVSRTLILISSIKCNCVRTYIVHLSSLIVEISLSKNPVFLTKPSYAAMSRFESSECFSMTNTTEESSAKWIPEFFVSSFAEARREWKG